jgi:hypothetical protein
MTRINIPAAPDGFKTRLHWLHEALCGSYSRRRGYQLPERNLEAWRFMLAGGWTASRRFLPWDKTPYTFSPPDSDEQFSLRDVKKLIQQPEAQP